MVARAFGFILLLCAGAAHAAGLEPRLARLLATAGPETPQLAWVFFLDRGPTHTMWQASPRAAARRALRGKPGAATADQPPSEAYIDRVRPHVIAIRRRSRWFNAVSVEATPAQLATLARLPMVRELGVVTRAPRDPVGAPTMDPGPHAPSPRGIALDYGPSFPQAQRVQLPPLHDRGLTGAGVLIAHFDNGYRLLSHQAFASTRIVARRDFVDGDGDPALPPSAPPGWGEHGLYTLSVVAGNFPGKLIGAAFGADFALARTENDASETPFEEDNWVAAMEWADSLGADVISSSVGYLDYQNPADSWSWQDLNGNTTVVTRAADLAVARGIVVVNAAGNSGFNAAHNTLLAPADGDSVVTVGGVQPDGQIYLSSSVGPTTANPPRIKPDVMAQATAVYIAGTGNTMHYGYNSGTSFAAPMVAGIAALLLEAKPDATPVEVANALRATASRAATPDNSFGWGIVNAEAALARLTIAVEPASMSRVKGLFR